MKQRPEPPKRTSAMVKLDQIWAWIWDEPLPKPDFDEPWSIVSNDTPGHWEVRGTGVIDDQVPVGKHWRFL